MVNKIKIDKTQVFGFESALRGMRNPLNSWDKSDSFCIHQDEGGVYRTDTWQEISDVKIKFEQTNEGFVLGDADKTLAQKLTKAGSEHCKFLRQIHVWADFTFPRYWWSEMDTYSHNTKNSTSTMHKLMSRDLTFDDFIFDAEDTQLMRSILSSFDRIRFDYLQTDNVETKHYLLRRAKQLLPEGYLQMRTMDTNYAELLNVYNQRFQHKLKPEWQDIMCSWIENLPYFVELTGIDRKFTLDTSNK